MSYKFSIWVCLLVSAVLLAGVCTSALAQVNLAMQATASASSEGAPAFQANDGMDWTWWAPLGGQEPNSWLQLHWESVQTFNKLVIHETDRYVDILGFDVQVLNEGNWQTVAYTVETNASGDTIATFNTVTSTDVRIVLTSAVEWQWVDIGEFQVFNVPVMPDNLARTATVTVSGVFGSNTANLAIDGNIYTGWESDSPGGGKHLRWIQLAWDEPQTFNKVVAWCGIANNEFRYPHSYWLLTSLDGTNWTNQGPFASYVMGWSDTYRGNLNILLPQPVTAKYVRLRLACQNTNGKVMVDELEVFNASTEDWVTLSGQVTDSVSGKGLKMSQIDIIDPTNSARPHIYAVDSDWSGNFSIVVPAGNYKMNVRAPGYTSISQQDLTVGPDAQQTLNLQLSVNTMWTNFPKATWVADATRTGVSCGLLVNDISQYPYETATAGPAGDVRDCLKVTGTPGIAFDMDNAFYQGYSDQAWISVTYLDNGTSAVEISVNNNAWDNGAQPKARIFKTNTGQWVTKSVAVPSMFLKNGYSAGNKSNEFFVGPANEYIAGVSVEFAPPSTLGQLPLSLTIGMPNIENGMYLSDGDYMNGMPSIVSKGGKWAAETTGSRSAIGIAVDDARFFGVKDLWVIVEYFDEGTDTFRVGGRRTSDGSVTWLKYVTKQDTKTWKILPVWVPACYLQNIYNPYDINITDESDGDEWIHSVTVTTEPPASEHISTIDKLFAPEMINKVVTLTNKTVTNNWGARLWLEEEDRSSAIRVNMLSNQVVPAGKKVSVTGVVSIVYGMVMIDNAQITIHGDSEVIRPLYMSNSTALLSTGTETNALYARLFGTVTNVRQDGTTTTEFDMTDGSGQSIFVQVVDDRHVLDPQVGDHVMVEGNIAKYWSNATTYSPMIVVTSPSKYIKY